jgi:hypothetical protein
VPALYFVNYAEMTGPLSNKAELLGHAHGFTIVGGFKSLWQRVADELSDVRCGVRIHEIKRDGDGVRVETDDGVVEADDLVLTIPLDQVIDVLDASPEEAAVAERIRNIDYHTTVCSASGLPESAFYLVRQHAADPATTGHAVAFHHRYPGSDDYVCYSYGSEGADAVAASLRDDVNSFGGEFGTLHAQEQWAFMPHFSSDELAAGILDRVEELQGHRNTYHAGSMLAFELVECNSATRRSWSRGSSPGCAKHPPRAVPLRRRLRSGRPSQLRRERPWTSARRRKSFATG